MLNRVEQELPFTSDITKADNDIELWELMERVTKSMDDLIAVFEAQPQDATSEDLPMHELLCLDKQLRSICGTLKMEMELWQDIEKKTQDCGNLQHPRLY